MLSVLSFFRNLQRSVWRPDKKAGVVVILWILLVRTGEDDLAGCNDDVDCVFPGPGIDDDDERDFDVEKDKNDDGNEVV